MTIVSLSVEKKKRAIGMALLDAISSDRVTGFVEMADRRMAGGHGAPISYRKVHRAGDAIVPSGLDLPSAVIDGFLGFSC